MSIALSRWVAGSYGLLLAISGCAPSANNSDAADGSPLDATIQDGSDASIDVLALPYCYNDPRTQPYADGASASGQLGLITLQLTAVSPMPPVRANYGWTLVATDAHGQGVDGLAMTILPWMPDHGHGAPVIPMATEMGNGRYAVSNIDLFMEGVWTVTFQLFASTAALDGGATVGAADAGVAMDASTPALDTATFTFCVGP